MAKDDPHFQEDKAALSAEIQRKTEEFLKKNQIQNIPKGTVAADLDDTKVTLSKTAKARVDGKHYLNGV